MLHWVFQYNPQRFDQIRTLGSTDHDWWGMKQGRDLVSVGDRIYFWKSGPQASVTAVGHVASPVYERPSQFGQYAVDVTLEVLVEPPLTREEVRMVLSHVAVFQGWQGTNFRLAASDAMVLDQLLANRLKPFSSDASAHKGVQATLKDLSDAIQRNNTRIKAELRELVQAMDPRGFEFLVRRVLIALGYHDVVVTRYSGDKGIDATAIFDVGTATPVEVAIQAKRTRSVDRPTVQSLRGSLTSRQIGLLVTSGIFTAAATVESQEAGKVPIGLIDGSKLIEIMVAKGIGIRETHLPALRLIPEALSTDALTAEEAEEPPSSLSPV